MKELLNSKRFWVSFLGTLAATGAGMAGQPWYVCLGIVAGAAGYAISQGSADQGKVVERMRAETKTKEERRA